MNGESIRMKLREKGVSQSDVARQYGCSPQAVHCAVTGKSNSLGLQHFIAHLLGVRREILFGRPKRRSPTTESA